MHTSISLITLFSIFLPLTLAETLTDLPQCAQNCFITAVTGSVCGPLDAYCQCTEGADQIRSDTISCLCQSKCTTTDLMKAQQVSNAICSSALAISSQTYEATTVGLEVCQATGGAASGESSSGTTTAASSDASTTDSSSDSDSESASSSASASVESQSGNAAAPAVTGMVGLQGAVIGIVGLGLMAL